LIEIKTPYNDLLPPLSTEEFDALKADVEKYGVKTPIVIDEDNNILDGHHRYKINPNAPFEILSGLSKAQKLAYIYRSNLTRRNLSSEQKNEIRKAMKKVAFSLKEEGLTEIEIAGLLGTSRRTINEWIIMSVVNIDNAHNSKQPKKPKKVGIKVPQEIWDEVFTSVDDKTQEQIAANLGVKQSAVSRAKKSYEKRKNHKINSVVNEIVSNPALLFEASWDEWLPKQDNCDLLLTDPPYMTDIENISDFAHTWLPIALAKVKPTGRAYICIGSYPEELKAYLTADYSVMKLENILVWTYKNTLGPSPKRIYKNNWQAILYFAGLEAPDLDCPKMTEQNSVMEINAPDGRLGNRFHTWQKPDELARRLISHSTKPGQLILDPFAGTGTFLIMASKMNRIAVGCDNNKEMIDIAIKRGCSYAG
jgi:DNA modification methylase/plasmid maintenance system antidote protein VapI